MTLTASPQSREDVVSAAMNAELEAYNYAFLELELPWQWDAQTYLELRRRAVDADCVSAYVERNHSHLLRVYDKSFLRDLVLSIKSRYQGVAAA
ncbi:MAG: hypothetical protein JSR54_01705 [Proteobacteria bacterium]|nr:hypothetical protein [Pseudomonadota bacterium]